MLGVHTVGEFIFNLFLLIALLVFWVDSFQIEVWNDYIGARYYPMVILSIAVILLLIKVIRAWKEIPPEKRQEDLQGLRGCLKIKGNQRLALAFLCFLLYVMLLPVAGFLLSTFLFGIAASWLLGAKKPLQLIAAGACSSLPLFMVFVWGLNFRLPRGTGVLYSVALFLENLI